MALTDNLVSYWKLDEASGSAADSHGTTTLTNNNTVGYAAALINNGANFGTGNTSKYLSTTSLMGFTVNGARSFSAWVKMQTELSGADDNKDVISTGFTTEQVGYIIEYVREAGVNKINAGRYRNGIQGAALYYSTDLGTANWHHIVYTIDASSNQTLYVDGVSRATDTTSTLNGGADGPRDGLNISRLSHSANVRFIDAYVDEVGVWSRALTAAEVTSLYNGGAGLAYPFTGGTTANPAFLMNFL